MINFFKNTISGFIYAARTDAVTGEVLIFWTGATSFEEATKSDKVHLVMSYEAIEEGRSLAHIYGRTHEVATFEEACELAELPRYRFRSYVGAM